LIFILKASRSPSSATLDAPLSKIMSAADIISTRRGSTAVSADFIYQTMKLLYRLGTLDAENNLRVHRLR
jgi:hypothetical protein